MFPGNSRTEKEKRGPAGPDRGSEEGRIEVRPYKMQLIRSGLGLRSRLDADEAAVTALVFELYEAGNKREERVVLALTDVFSRLVLGATLAHQNRASVNQLPAEPLDAQPLAVRIAAVCGGAAAFLMCHDVILFEKNCRVEARRNVKSYSLISLTCTAV